jgi:hypothetical protein
MARALAFIYGLVTYGPTNTIPSWSDRSID